MIDLSKLDEKAMEAAAKALNDLWCPTCQPYSDTGAAHIQYCQKSARAAITAYLATSTMTTQDLLREALEALDRVLLDVEFMWEDGTLPDRHDDVIYVRARAAADKIRAALKEEQNT